MKIRKHRGSAAESLDTMREIQPTIAAIAEYLNRNNETPFSTEELKTIAVRPYGGSNQERTFVVTINGNPVAFTDSLTEEMVMSEQWIRYNGVGFPVPLGSDVEVKLYPINGDVRTKLGKLVSYESYSVIDHETDDKSGFYWKLYNGVTYFNFNYNEIEYYKIIKSSVPEKTVDELAVCKDLLLVLFHGSSKDFKYRGITYLRRYQDLRNSEICNLLGLQVEDIEFILNNPNDIQ